MKISKQNRDDIKSAIKNAEMHTSGEIVPVILSSSDQYPGSHFRSALFFGFLFSLLTYILYDFDDPIILLWSQIPGMIFGHVIANISFIKRMLTTKSEMNEEVYQRAIQIYFENKVSSTVDRTGILIFISLFERKVHVLSDTGINNIIPTGFWDEIVKDIISNIKKDQTLPGLIDAIDKCGVQLSSHFPAKHDDQNELLDGLITDLK